MTGLGVVSPRQGLARMAFIQEQDTFKSRTLFIQEQDTVFESDCSRFVRYECVAPRRNP